jgi:hypothetical protein
MFSKKNNKMKEGEGNGKKKNNEHFAWFCSLSHDPSF